MGTAAASPGVSVSAGFGAGWRRMAEALRAAIPVEEIDRIWLFAPVRQAEREWGTAVISRRIGGHRRRIYTATYVVIARGRDRGQGRVTVEEVGESPADVVDGVVLGVQLRTGETQPPDEVSPALLTGAFGDQPAAQA